MVLDFLAFCIHTHTSTRPHIQSPFNAVVRVISVWTDIVPSRIDISHPLQRWNDDNVRHGNHSEFVVKLMWISESSVLTSVKIGVWWWWHTMTIISFHSTRYSSQRICVVLLPFSLLPSLPLCMNVLMHPWEVANSWAFRYYRWCVWHSGSAYAPFRIYQSLYYI